MLRQFSIAIFRKRLSADATDTYNEKFYHSPVDVCSLKDVNELMEESLKMKALSHPNIINLIGVSVDAGDSPYIVMPYMANGSLLSYLRKERPNLTIAAGAGVDLVSSIRCVQA